MSAVTKPMACFHSMGGLFECATHRASHCFWRLLRFAKVNTIDVLHVVSSVGIVIVFI